MTDTLRVTALLLAVLIAAPASAFDLGDGKLELGVSGGVAYGRTDGNSYLTGSEEGQYDNSKLAFTVFGHPSDRILIGGRIDIDSSEEGAEIDWAFAEFRVNDKIRLRAGMAKHPFGNYGETIEEGTFRPFQDAPISLYGPNNIAGESYTGVGFTGFHRLGEGWTLTYDLYAGELDVETNNAHLLKEFGTTEVPGTEYVIETRELLGGRVSLETPVDGLTARISAYTGVEAAYGTGDAGETRHNVVAVSGEYLGEALSLRAEYATSVEANQTSTQAGYVEAAWKFENGLQFAGRLDATLLKVDGRTFGSTLNRSNEAAVGVNYWFSPAFVVRAAYHYVYGNRFAVEELEGTATLPPAEAPKDTTQLFTVGAQFRL